MARLQRPSRQERMARLQQSRVAQAGIGCHGGGIILSKKPPEWHLSLPLPVGDFWFSLLPLPVAGSWCSLLPLPVARFWCSLLPLPVADFWCSLLQLPRGFTTGSHEGDAVKAF